MKNLIIRFTLPITILSFVLITKWWYGADLDVKDAFFYGFPMIYKCEGFHTSMSTQYFVLELAVNFIAYFCICLIISLILFKIRQFTVPKKISLVFWIGFVVVFTATLYLSYEMKDVYPVSRDFQVKIFDSGFSFLEQTPDREVYMEDIQEWLKK